MDKGKVKIIGLAIANGLESLSGCIFAQEQRFFDVSMGTGTMVIGLASVIIGTKSFENGLLSFGVDNHRCCDSVLSIYKACVAAGHQLWALPATDLKFITAALFLIILVAGNGAKEEGEISMLEMKSHS